jgi:hypothetical protein
MIRLDNRQIDQLRSILKQDPELADLLDRAPFVQHPSNLEEGVWQKMFGKKEALVQMPSQFPPRAANVQTTAQWVKDWVAYHQQQGNDPVKLFDPNQLQGSIWLAIRAGHSEQLAKDVLKHLWNDKHIGPMIKSAPRYQHQGQVIAPSDVSYTAGGRTSHRDSGHALGNIINQLWEDEHQRNGTIVTLKLSHHSAKKLFKWCHDNNISSIHPNDMHLTVLFSETPVPQLMDLHNTHTHVKATASHWKLLGKDALTLIVHCDAAVKLHRKLIGMGGTHSWPSFLPHVTVVYGWNHSHLPANLPDFDLVFDRIHTSAIDPDYVRNRST